MKLKLTVVGLLAIMLLTTVITYNALNDLDQDIFNAEFDFDE